MNDQRRLSDADLELATASVLRDRADRVEVSPGEIRARVRAAGSRTRRRDSGRRLISVLAVATVLVVGGAIALSAGGLNANPKPTLSSAPASALALASPTQGFLPAPRPIWTTLRWSATAPAPFGGPGNQYVFGATHWSGGFVLVGEDAPSGAGKVAGVVWQSPNGIDWKRIPNKDGMFDSAEIRAIAARGSTLVAVGVARRDDSAQTILPPVGLVWTSHDGVNWTRDPEAESTVGQAVIFGVAAGPTGFVAFGNDLVGGVALFFSDDGVQWRRVGQGDPAFSGMEVASLTATATGYSAVGGQRVTCRTCVGDAPGTAAAWWSADGLTWHLSAVESGGYALGGVQLWAGSLRAVGSSGCGGCVAGPVEWRSVDDGHAWRRLPTQAGPPSVKSTALLVDGAVVELDVQAPSKARWTGDGQTWHPLLPLGATLSDQTQLEVATDGTLIAIASASGKSRLPGDQVDVLVFIGMLR